jgi:hypothetical protein
LVLGSGRCPDRSCAGGGRRRGCISGGGGGGRRVTKEVPGAVNNTGRFRRKEVEETTGKVETTVGAPGTFVHDGSNGVLSVVTHANLLEAVGTRVSATILCGIQGDNEITCDADLTTGALSDVVECPPGVIETLMESNVSWSAPGNGVMTGSVRTSVGICYGLWGKKGEC